jgi:hypothetical protein
MNTNFLFADKKKGSALSLLVGGIAGVHARVTYFALP